MIILHLSGGLGNQMFQYAFGRALADRCGAELSLDLSDATLQTYNGFELNSVFDIQARIATQIDIQAVLGWQSNNIIRNVIKKIGVSGILSSHYIEEPYFDFAPQMLHVPDNVYLSGYWQSEKYFADAIDSIRNEFKFRHLLSGLNEVLAAEFSGGHETAVSLHVRRGDYVHNPTISKVHGNCSVEYYQAAVQYVAARVQCPRFYLFSDDIDWIRANLDLPFPHVFVEHNRGKASYEDMRLMSMCRHHIIANSTFSWWGAWLNPRPEKIVVAPQKWFIDENNVKDLFPQRWVTL